MSCQVNLARSKTRQRTSTRPAESSGRLLERHGNVSPREMAVKGARAPEQNPAYRPARSHHDAEGPDHPLIPRGATGSFTLVGPRDQPAAREAAPMMPDALRCTAATMGVLSSSSGRNFSGCLETPPPTTNRSGL